MKFILLYKLFLNSLYGKFGQTAYKFEKISDCDPDNIGSGHFINAENNQIEFYKWFGGSLFQKSNNPPGENESYNSFTAIAGHVTAYSRLILYDAMKIAGKIYYCDTDSIFTNKPGYDNLSAAGYIDQDALGKFKLEKTGTATIYGLKDYKFVDENGAEEIKLKGVSKNSEKINDLDFITTNWIGLDKAIHQGNLDGYKNILNKKTIRQTAYNKGLVLNSGHILPYNLAPVTNT